MNFQPLQGMLVVSLEHAVAAPYCSSRLANAGARVIKVERPEGDFARGYDREVYGESSYFVWINQGKESVALDLHRDADRQQMLDLLAQADVRETLSKAGADPVGSSPEQFASFIRSETVKWGAAVKRAGITPE